MKPFIYSLERLQQKFITNTDGTTSGTFDEIFTTTQTGNRYDISVDMCGCETIICTYEKNKPEDKLVLITYLENELD
jgi:hypothetical protein